MVGVVAFGLVALWLPSLVPSVPEPASLPAIAVLVVGLASTDCSRSARDEAGKAFDARCVAALERVLDSGRPAWPVAV